MTFNTRSSGNRSGPRGQGAIRGGNGHGAASVPDFRIPARRVPPPVLEQEGRAGKPVFPAALAGGAKPRAQAAPAPGFPATGRRSVAE